MTTKQLFDALHRAKRGDVIIYHTGLLMRDRQRNALVNETAAAAWALHLRHEVCLWQNRVSPGVCDYYVVKVREAA